MTPLFSFHGKLLITTVNQFYFISQSMVTMRNILRWCNFDDEAKWISELSLPINEKMVLFDDAFLRVRIKVNLFILEVIILTG